MEMDMNRNFVRSTLDADHRTSAYKITCFQCGTTDKVAAASHSGSLPPEVTIKKFRQRGWAVGNRAGADLCVTCVTRNRMARKAPATITIAALPAPPKIEGVILPDLTEQPPEKILTINEAYDAGWCGKDKLYDRIRSGELPKIKAADGSLAVKESDLIRLFKEPKGIRKYTPKKTVEPPSVNELKPLVDDGVIKMAMLSIDVMTKEDRRIIFSEIDSHYLDEKHGYDKDWDDEKVATGLKVSIEWVRNIREDNFGPEKGNGIDAEVEKLKEASAEAQKLIDTMRAVWKEMDATLATYEEKQAELSAEANKISKMIIDAKAAIDAANSRK
jgi:hypothetical protein